MNEPSAVRRIVCVCALACLTAASPANPPKGEPSVPVEFRLIQAGTFMMGAGDGVKYAAPVHEVRLKAFEMSKTLVTVEQYAECVVKGRCEAPGTGRACNWGKADRSTHPINCVNWKEAADFAKFAGARLPSEAEYEYAATSRGKNRPYPWGREKPTCAKVVMAEGGYGCDGGGTMPVCSKPAGSTEQGLCDMTGNLWEWMQDSWHDSYEGAPRDGGAWETSDYVRAVRGGAFRTENPDYLRVDYRRGDVPAILGGGIGFRLARSIH